MQIKLNTKELNRALNKLFLLIDKRDQGIMQSVFFEATGGQITLKSGNVLNNLTITTSGDILRAGNACIDALALQKICKNIKAEEVVLEYQEGEEVATIEANNLLLKAPCFDPLNYPLGSFLYDFENAKEATATGLIDAINFVKVAMAKKEEARKYLVGVYLKNKKEEGKIEATATCGHWLLQTQIIGELVEDLFLDEVQVNLICKIFKDSQELKISTNKTFLKVDAGGISFVLKSQEGNMSINFDTVKPDVSTIDNHYQIEAASFSSALLQILDDRKNHPVRLNWDGQGNLKLESKVGELTLKSNGNALKTAFNAKYLIAICKQLGDCRMSLRDGTSPAIFQTQTSISVLMPVRF